MDALTANKWDRASRTYDFMNGYGPERRWAPFKRELYSAMEGKILFAAVGTGLDIPLFPPDRDIVGIDISPGMLERARPRAQAYAGRIELRQMDVRELDFPDGSFDQVFTACTFCSVPDPVSGLKELRRVLRPGGELRMFEHTGSRIFPFSLMLHLMTPLSRRIGPDMNRDTVANVLAAGFKVQSVRNLYLDIVRAIRAIAPAASAFQIEGFATVCQRTG